ncbi:hypothetical protein [Haliangium ochraceum]|nr:hypothetical protein [Haliangium ochraceum]
MNDDTEPSPPPPPPARDAAPWSCELRIESRTEQAIRLTAVFHNRSDAPAHLLRTERMPYVAVDGGVLRVRWSIEPPDPDKNYGMLEIPLTDEVAAGAKLTRTATLPLPLHLSAHLDGPTPYAGDMPGDAVAEFGVSERRIDASQRHTLNYPKLAAEQRVCRSPAVPLASAAR